MEPIEIRRMRVRSGALDLEVGLALDTLYVDAGQAERILGLRTTVSFANDFVALGAMNCALEIIDWSLDPDSREAPDVDGMIALLAAM